jgi:hypothetical protein
MNKRQKKKQLKKLGWTFHKINVGTRLHHFKMYKGHYPFSPTVRITDEDVDKWLYFADRVGVIPVQSRGYYPTHGIIDEATKSFGEGFSLGGITNVDYIINPLIYCKSE